MLQFKLCESEHSPTLAATCFPLVSVNVELISKSTVCILFSFAVKRDCRTLKQSTLTLVTDGISWNSVMMRLPEPSIFAVCLLALGAACCASWRACCSVVSGSCVGCTVGACVVGGTTVAVGWSVVAVLVLGLPVSAPITASTSRMPARISQKRFHERLGGWMFNV